jgi:hypothetical protein
VRAFEELLREALDRGMAVTVMPDAPPDLQAAAEAARAARAASATETAKATDPPTPEATPTDAETLIIAGSVPPARPGGWSAVDLPLGEALPVRRLAAALAQKSWQAYEVLRLGAGRAVLLAHAAGAPEAVGPLFGVAAPRRGALEAARTASDTEVLALANAGLLAAEEANVTLEAAGAGFKNEADTLRAGVAEAQESEAAAWRRYRETNERLTARIGEISASPFYRAERKLRHLAALVRRPVERKEER